jgi:chondroitin AC lyase
LEIGLYGPPAAGTETGNGENVKGFHLADGCNFILRRGDEYKAIFPAWNWRRIPGITCQQLSAPYPEVNWGRGAKGTTSFVGAVSDGDYGVAAFDFNRTGVEARKAWFCFDKQIVCLGAGISCAKGNHPVTTSVNQCLLKGPVTTPDGKKAKGKIYLLSGPQFVHHDGVGYVFPGKAAVHLEVDRQDGNWYDINRMYTKDPVSMDIFGLWINHGKNPKNASYEYHILPGTQAAEVASYVKQNGVAVLMNTPALQAVCNKKLQFIGAAFYAPGKLESEDGPTIQVDSSCIVLIQALEDGRWRVALSKPDTKAKTIKITIDGRKSILELPIGEQAGSSLIHDLGTVQK